ncbi:conserved hypothetical protein [Leishmania mexicana MHOM/GT/2001/U1103]|uniref:Uncharacterized protein n=1 Tax=Leishmania mexicana (strain MHOM/GT/2001/U1103) TaxID=929439 RepID=E9ASU6_LEIMU|nr:conserved hypothetical protein [Leishmania mexicana MHOM/GT/2001/U1103]CBZ26020.1 conserved hypothetical protein [Leishmania mexicana MHOM/GT/2001/U1103]
MNRTSVRLFGNYSRTSGAQQHSQATHTSSSSTTRSSSVLGSLVRMRNQFHRLRHTQQQQAIAAVLARYQLQPALKAPAASTSRAAGQIDGDDSLGQEGSSDAVGSAASSVLQTAIILCTEALRLLKSEVRCHDNLSDVPKSSPMYGSEIGKLLNIAAAFGASTTFPRVQHALHWIKLNKESLHTPRQVMSLCMPLLSLADGRTAGVAFVLEELYEPLLFALQDVASSSPESAAESADNAPSDTTAAVQQHLVAITSAMGMVAKWSSPRLGSRSKDLLTSSPLEVHTAAKSDATVEELDKMLRIAEACAAALRRQIGRCHGTGSDEVFVAMAHLSPSDVLQWIQCLHGLEKMYALVAPTLGISRAEAEAASRRLLLCYRALLPLMQRTLELAGGGGGATVAAASNATLATGATATSVRVTDVVELIQVGLQASIEASHVDLALSYGLQALPGALASAMVKDLSDAAQVVNKVRQKRPSALPAPLLLSIQAAFRPALFLLRETHALQLRASDCGVLLSSLSRWEEVPGVTVSADIVELLSQRFGEQMHVVGASQLVPFVASLARFEERKRSPQRSGAAGQAVENAAVLGEGLAGDGARLASSGVAWKTSEGPADSLTSSPVRGARTRGAEGVRYRFCTTSRIVSQCVQRAIVLAGDNETPGDPAVPSRLSPADAAQLLTYFVQLSAPQCAGFFNKAEPLLASAMQGSADTPSTASAAIRLRVVAGDAVQRFVRYAAQQREQTWAQCRNPTTQEIREEACVVEAQRATALLRGMSRGLAKLIREAASPKDLVLACSLLRRRLLNKGAAAGVIVDGGEAALKKLKGTKPSTTAARARTRTRAWTRKELELAAVFAAQAVKMAPECKGVELGALASATSSFCTAGVLPRPVAQQFMRAVWARCAAGLAVASMGEAAGPEAAAALTLSLENCKTIMDASRSAHLSRTAPPVIFLEAFAAQCSELLEGDSGAVGGEESPSTVRGTARAYAEAVTKLRRTADLGRSLVSYFGSLRPCRRAAEGDVAMQSTTWREAQVRALESYLEVAHSVVETYATEATLSETWWAELDDGSPPPMPLELLSTTANVMAQVYRLMHRGVGSTTRVSGVPETAPTVLDGVPDTEDNVLDGSLAAVDGAGVAVLSELACKTLEDDVEPSPLLDDSPANLSTATLDQAVRDTLGLLGDTIVALVRQQQQQLSSSVSADVSDETATEDYSGRLTTAPVRAFVQNPKHLLMLLRAFETVEHPHPEMLYSVLPELRGCADRLDPLELSLLIRALTQLGAWNSRLLSALATAVASKINQCELRQCYTLLHGLCRSGCTSPDTYVELRSTPRRDWNSGCGGASNKAAAQEPLQRLVEITLLRLDAFVRTKDSFMSLARTAAVGDLVGVAKALRFFYAPPPATYDAFVVLAVRRLASQAQRLSLGTVVQHTMALLYAVSELRRPEQQRVSAQALWTVLRRAFASSTEASEPGALTETAGDAFGGVLHLPACWELTRFAAVHSLQYGREATRDFFAPIVASTTEQRVVSCARLTQTRLARFIETHASDVAADTHSPSPPLTAADRAALRRYALHASPCLVRGDRELEDHMCAPLKLARLITDGDPTTLVHAATTAAPAAQARQCIRLLACLLRTDLWAPSISAATADTQMLVAALRRLWTVAELHGLLRDSPGAFSTEELLVLAAAADRVHQYSIDAGNLQQEFAVAVRQLCAATTVWRLPAAVDAWMLFAMPFMASSSIPAAALPDCSDELFLMLVASGDVLVTRFAHAQRSWATSGARMLPELVRLFRGPGQLDVAMLQPRAVGDDTLSFALPHTAPDASTARVRFVVMYEELLRCFTLCLA